MKYLAVTSVYIYSETPARLERKAHFYNRRERADQMIWLPSRRVTGY